MSNNEFNLKELIKELNELNSKVVKRLELIIYLLLQQRKREIEIPKKEIIQELYGWGFSDIEIAKILGKSRGYISGEITQFRKSKKKEKESKWTS